MQSRYALILALIAPCAWAQCDGFDATGWVELAHEPPLVQVDGTPIADDPVTQYRVYWGTTPAAFPNQREFPADAESFCVDGLPSTGSVYFVATAWNSKGEGTRTNVACFTMSGAACLPGPYETDVLSVTFSDPGAIPPTASWSKGFNFRATAGFTTDPPGDTYVTPLDPYPTTRNGVTFGWRSINPANSARDRDQGRSVSPRFAGVNFIWTSDALPVAEFQIDLPAPGLYRVRLAAGDGGSSFNYARYEIRDGGVMKSQQAAVLMTVNTYKDAAGVTHTGANWLTSNQPIEVMMTTTDFRLVLPKSPGASVIAHLSLERM